MNIKYKPILQFYVKHAKKYKLNYFFIFLPTIVCSFSNSISNYIIKVITDLLISDNVNINQIGYYIVLFIISTLGFETIWRISQIAEMKTIPYVNRDITVSVYKKIQNKPYHFFQVNYVGLITSKIKNILDNYSDLLSDFHHGLGLHMIRLFINLCVLFGVNIKLGIFVTVLSVLTFIYTIYISKKLNDYVYQETDALHRVIGKISDRITNIAHIFSFSKKNYEVKRLSDNITQDLIPRQKQTYKEECKLLIILSIFFVINSALVTYYTISLKVNNSISLGDVILAFGLAVSIEENIWVISSSYSNFMHELGELENSLMIMSDNEDIDNIKILNTEDNSTVKDITIVKPNIHFEHVYFSYPNDHNLILNDFSLKIDAGEHIGIIGSSGVGKSSIFSLLLRYYDCKQGNIFIDDKNICNYSPDSIRKYISLIPQDTILFNRSIMDNIKYANNDVDDDTIIEMCKKFNLHEIIMKMPDKYNTIVGERGSKLSGGQRQRIAILRALLKDAPILLLDEATSALDVKTEAIVQQDIDHLLEDKNKTIMIIAHKIATLRHMDKIIVIDKGKIIESGTHDELMNMPYSKYKTLWNMQI